MTIYKYPVNPDTGDLSLPVGAEILHANGQQLGFFVWALVDEHELESTPRKVRIFGTGHPVDFERSRLRYLNTFLLASGSLVFHAFEVIA